MLYEDLLKISPYSLEKEKKEKILTERLVELTELHKQKCPEYGKILNSLDYDKCRVSSYKNLPFLPVRLFKELSLKSIPQDDVVKTMTSSGTSGQAVSKIYLDKITASNQQKTMVKIVSDFIGSARMPMIIIDCPSVVKNRQMFSARGAGILGFSIFGAKKIYALDDDMKLDVDGIAEFLDNYRGQRILLFGFTFMIWQYFYKELVRLRQQGISFDFSNSVLIHGGGWKKLASEAVSQEEFHENLKAVCGLDNIHDYYGMVEQTGCIYMQCECGHLHASNFSDVIIRRAEDFSECETGEKGIIQVVSTVPESYPGHSLLTEDEGMILGEDDCPCGRKGKYFKIFGRLKNAEIRGCSDTFAVEHGAEINADGSGSDTSCLAGIQYMVGNENILLNMPSVSPRKAFSESVLEFLSDLSKELMTDSNAKIFPDVVTLGFWMRKSSLVHMRKHFLPDSTSIHMGRGMAFHIAPSNVPVNYAYSLCTGLLCGNANIVRIPSKDFPQVRIINHAIQAVLEKHKGMKPYICLVRYERSRKINDFLSLLCDTRIIWGGDATIADIRKSALLPRATEITFADRYSLAVIDSDMYLKMTVDVSGNIREDAVSKIASGFYNDTYLSDQNACTSPRVVVWTGSKKAEAKRIFWDGLYNMAKKKYHFQPVQGIDKLSMFCMAAAEDAGGIKTSGCHKDNLLIRVQVSELDGKLMNYRGNSGYFYEYDSNDIMELKNFCNDMKCQTLGLLGDREMLGPLLESGIKGIDRIVPIGHTMDFDLLWDGYNLVERLTRTIVQQNGSHMDKDM